MPQPLAKAPPVAVGTVDRYGSDAVVRPGAEAVVCPMPVYDQTKRRKTKHTAGKKKSTAQASQVDNGSGKGRVALEQTIVVGRVYIQRMERTGMDRRDAGKPPREPG